MFQNFMCIWIIISTCIMDFHVFLVAILSIKLFPADVTFKMFLLHVLATSVCKKPPFLWIKRSVNQPKMIIKYLSIRVGPDIWPTFDIRHITGYPALEISRIVSIYGIRPDIENSRIYGPTLLSINSYRRGCCPWHFNVRSNNPGYLSFSVQTPEVLGVK